LFKIGIPVGKGEKKHYCTKNLVWYHDQELSTMTGRPALPSAPAESGTLMSAEEKNAGSSVRSHGGAHAWEGGIMMRLKHDARLERHLVARLVVADGVERGSNNLGCMFRRHECGWV
jgi:hypothetical protein